MRNQQATLNWLSPSDPVLTPFKPVRAREYKNVRQKIVKDEFLGVSMKILKFKDKMVLYLYNFLGMLFMYNVIDTLIDLVYKGLIKNQEVVFTDILHIRGIIFSIFWALGRTKPDKYIQTERTIMKTYNSDNMENLNKLFLEKNWILSESYNGEVTYIPRYWIFNLFGKVIVKEEELSFKLIGPDTYVDFFTDKFIEKYKKPYILQ